MTTGLSVDDYIYIYIYVCVCVCVLCISVYINIEIYTQLYVHKSLGLSIQVDLPSYRVQTDHSSMKLTSHLIYRARHMKK